MISKGPEYGQSKGSPKEMSQEPFNDELVTFTDENPNKINFLTLQDNKPAKNYQINRAALLSDYKNISN